MRLSFLIGYGGSALPLISKLLKEESEEHGFDYIAINSDLSEQYLEEILESDFVAIYAHELPKTVHEALKNCKAKIIAPISEILLDLSKGEGEFILEVSRYFKVGGERNLRNLIHLALRKLGLPVEVEPVEDVPWHGIYHPRFGVFRSIEEYMSRYELRRPTVGIIFFRSQWIYGNTLYIDEIIEELEKEGLSVLPVFAYGSRDDMLKTPTAEDSIRTFFFKEGKALVDIILSAKFFFLLDHGNYFRDKGGGLEVSNLELLKKLNVPIIDLVLSSYKSVEEWLKEPEGLDYFSQVYGVIMPEVDGIIEPIFVAGARIENGAKIYEPYRPHAKYIARRVKKWIELKLKDRKDRKIAIILINPPCKGLEASIAVGMGLDVPESIARLLKRLREIGYYVGEKIPENGKQLIDIILKRKAISEFRWTSVEEIVRRGGAVAFVDEKTYLEWFEELPEDVKNKMIEDWGHPSDVLNGRVQKDLVGMVYEGKFVIPGILFGNVFITPQPKFGCAGAACDGKVCRILHDPKISPPHQWLAVYRWITRVFRADLILHFGTHGYLEFRPGKGVGLSPSCWPEISIDDVPHLYIYIVSNPMEGVVAKRRSYATIVDHLYPPMTMAEVLDELDFLLNQYAKAKQIGDLTRAEIIFKEIIEVAKKNKIPVRENKTTIEEIHRYVEAVRGSQINLGLHVFGNPTRDPSKLADYVVTIMNYDSHSFPSIIRVLAECLGLDYDELRNEPLKTNEFGLTNSETIEILRKTAIKVIEKVLRNPELEGRIVEVVNSEIENLLGEAYAENR